MAGGIVWNEDIWSQLAIFMPDAFMRKKQFVTNCSAIIFKCKILRLSSQGDEADTVIGEKKNLKN